MDNPIDYLKEIWRVGSARESLDFIMGQTQYRSSCKSSGHKDPNAMNVSATQCGNGKSCFNCGGTGHHAKDCRKLKIECPDRHFLGGGHKKECMQLTPHKKLLCPGGTAVRGMLYDAMNVYFYDIKTLEDKEKGKANWMNREFSSLVRVVTIY